MKLTLLPSDKGDCLLLESPDKTSILIDGGMPDSYTDYVRGFLGKWREQNKRPLDLVYLSHIDQDHIAGALQLMNDLVDWRVYRHKTTSGDQWDKPSFPEPPEVKRLWHNGFHDMVDDNAGEIGSMLAARAAQLSASTNIDARNLGADYQAIAASIPESIKLSRRVSAAQLKIPLNKEFGGKLAMVRETPQKIRLNGANSPLIRVLGPFKEDLENLRAKWNEWLDAQKNQVNLARTRKWVRDEDERFDFGVVALDVDDQLGKRSKVTEENLASLMLLVERNGKRILLTGDGHYVDILKGLEHNGTVAPSKGLHVDVLKVQHHGSEHNFKREFAKRITADHYIICGNGRHENPDLRVLDVLAKSRLGSGDDKSTNPQVNETFHVWFNCSVKFLKRDVARRKQEQRPFKEYETAAEFFAKVENKMKTYQQQSGGKLKLHYLDIDPLVLDLGN
jgi:beta-lactamase superfamily II metal-dependent hydrolase